MRTRFTNLWTWIVIVTAVAYVVRGLHLDSQILGGDEIHLLWVITRRSLLEIPATVLESDYSVPLALLFRGVSEFVPLNECMLRAPVLAAGTVAPALLSLCARRFAPAGAALLLGWIVAVHPLFVFYGRFTRPYGPSMLLVIGVLFLLDLWHDRRRAWLLVAAAAFAALASWFTLVALTSVTLVFLGALLREAVTPSRGVTRRRAVLPIAAAGVGTLGAIAMLYAPGLGQIIELHVETKVGAAVVIDANVLWRNAAVLAGVPSRAGAAAVFALAVIGAIMFLLRWHARAIPLLVAAFGQPLVILLLRPTLLDFGFVLARYNFFVLPLWILFAAHVVHATLSALFRSRVDWDGPTPLGIIGAAVAALWLLLGPYGSIYTADNALAHHNFFQTFSHLTDPGWQAARVRSALAPVPPCYLGDHLDGATVVYEWPPPYGFNTTGHHFYQAAHHRPMRFAAFGDPPWSDPRLALANIRSIPGRGPLGLERGAVVVLDKKFSKRQAYLRTASRLSVVCGPPIFNDTQATVFQVR